MCQRDLRQRQFNDETGAGTQRTDATDAAILCFAEFLTMDKPSPLECSPAVGVGDNFENFVNKCC
jgi:hypothetical protein